MGDDYLGCYSYAKDVDKFELARALDHHESGMGITPMRSLFNNLMQVSFISLGFWPKLCGGYAAVPHPAKQMVKLFWTIRDMSGRSIEHQASALSVAFLPTYSGFPMMHQFLKRNLHHANPRYRFDAQDHYMLANSLVEKDQRVDWKKGFMFKYGLPYTACDIQLPNTKVRGVEIWHHPLVTHMLEVELRDPWERVDALTRPIMPD